MTKIVLDAGHGGKDPGATGFSLQEKDINLEITLKIGHYLKDYDCEIVYTRKEDKYVSLDDRTDLANKIKADLFLSVHSNASGGTGFESYIHPSVKGKNTDKLRYPIHDGVMDFLYEYSMRDRGKKYSNFHVLRETDMSAVLIENLFVDNKKDAELLKQNSFRTKLANAIASSIVQSLELQRSRPPTKNVDIGDIVYYFETDKNKNNKKVEKKAGIVTSLNTNGHANLCIFASDGILLRYNVPHDKAGFPHYFILKS